MTKPIHSQYSIRWIHQITDIPQTAWDELALDLPTPFLEWEWLKNMETSGSATSKAGWLPSHLTVWRDRQLVAVAPLYVKSHSYGEFVFDHQWADLAQRLGIDYYPKLLGMSPFTPAEGYRFLLAPGTDELELTELMVNAIDHFCDRNQISGCHFLYVDPHWRATIEACGFSSWLHHSYIWKNQGFQTFDDYLKIFNANQRRNIKRERKAVTQAGLEIRTLTGEQISQPLLSQMYHFYENTCDKFGWWGSKYLTRRFFEQLYDQYRHRVLLVAAYQGENDPSPMGMSFCIYKGERLYGRYWGSTEDIDCLHFDACYYSPIDWAIGHGVQIFDPGAGGRHKRRRGFPATPNHSVHRFRHPRLAQILQGYIGQVNELEQREMNQINAELPFHPNQS